MSNINLICIVTSRIVLLIQGTDRLKDYSLILSKALLIGKLIEKLNNWLVNQVFYSDIHLLTTGTERRRSSHTIGRTDKPSV